MLELAYWIGRTPGSADNDPALNRYRDLSRSQTANPTDRWVVFHLHMLEDSEMLRSIQGRTYMGVNRITMFHGQNVRWQGGAWRVDNRDFGGLNARDGFDCAEEEELWYVGSPRSNSALQGNELRFFNTLQTWAVNLYNNGYVGDAALSLIFQTPALLPNGHIDPSNPGMLQHPGGSSATLGGGDPYSVSWTVEPSQGQALHSYNFAPRAPPS